MEKGGEVRQENVGGRTVVGDTGRQHSEESRSAIACGRIVLAASYTSPPAIGRQVRSCRSSVLCVVWSSAGNRSQGRISEARWVDVMEIAEPR